MSRRKDYFVSLFPYEDFAGIELEVLRQTHRLTAVVHEDLGESFQGRGLATWHIHKVYAKCGIHIKAAVNLVFYYGCISRCSHRKSHSHGWTSDFALLKRRARGAYAERKSGCAFLLVLVRSHELGLGEYVAFDGVTNCFVGGPHTQVKHRV